MEKKPRAAIITVVLMLVLLTSIFLIKPPGATASKPIVLKWAIFTPEPNLFSTYLKWWGKELETRTKGGVKVEYYFGSTLGAAADHLSMASSGISHMSLIGPAYTREKLPLTTGLELGYQAKSYWVQHRATMELYETFLPFRKEYEKQNVKILLVLQVGRAMLGTVNKPIMKLGDLKGLKIRTYGWLSDAFTLLGATPVSLPAPELYMALQRGTVDGYTGMAIDVIQGNKLHEVAKYIVDPQIGQYGFFPIVMNLDTWKGLPADIRDTVDRLNEEYGEYACQVMNEGTLKTVKFLKDYGCQMSTLSNAEAASWQALVVPAVWDEWVGRMEKQGAAEAKDFLKRYRDLVKKYEPRDKQVLPKVF